MSYTVFVLLLIPLQPARAETGISDTEIRIGSTAARSGSVTPETGGGMARGHQPHYEHVNASGGVNGRKILFNPKDDVYGPAKAVANVKTLMERDKVFPFCLHFLAAPSFTRILRNRKCFSSGSATRTKRHHLSNTS